MTILNKLSGHEHEVRIVKRTLLIANTPNMPVMACEASIGIDSQIEV